MTKPSRRYLTVPVGDIHLTLSLRSAYRLRGELDKAISSAEQISDGLRPPRVNSNGFLGKHSFDEFFAQVYTEGVLLSNHSARLFTNIIRLACFEGIEFNVVCTMCGQHVKERCISNGEVHYYSKKKPDIIIEAVSLKTCLQTFLEGEWPNTGPKQKSDMKLLVDNLP